MGMNAPRAPRHERAMTLWQRLFGDDAGPVRPILLRLDLGGAHCPTHAVVEADWLPSRERAMYQLLTSSSMVLVPWRGESTRVTLTVRAGAHEGRAVVARADNRDGAVVHVALAEPLNLAS